MNKHLLSTSLAALFVTLAVGLLVLKLHGADDEDRDRGLVGTWHQTLTLASAPPFSPFQTLDSYTAGGVLIETASIDLIPALLSGPTQGAWVRTGHRSFRWTARAFSFNPTGTFIINQNLTLGEDGDSYSGAGSVEIVDSKGDVIPGTQDTFATTAKRISVQE